ncbi:Isochorismatase hydrolase [Dacryopinax primogenitus]|uniref:Isochorismatase hydrolase n=1 Tax=Dacryopinax primogenitus (strain DJM 731) TaxID=1858805 RepID=M5FZC0_DACPD|nr:Isochorismatase hydrolase [Dacryopinax primogenitus]EJT96852.1 Isochorismatase hydrolase [Dacryopinax primogenitus]
MPPSSYPGDSDTDIQRPLIEKLGVFLVKFGNHYNYWMLDTETNTFDLTRGGSKDAITFPTSARGNSSITIAPERSALVIIDMQKMNPRAELGRAAVGPTLDMIDAFRSNGMKIAWVQWGITEYDLKHLVSPALIYRFSGNKKAEGTSLCSEMGFVQNGTIDAGKKLCRGSWNAQAYGPLYDSYLKGKEMGTDFYFDKNSLSGLSGAMTPLEMWLRDSGITTLFFGGVNTDQCVWGTMKDSSFKGYDTIMVTDICATTSPEFATQMVLHNMHGRGWITNTGMILPVLWQVKTL